MFDFVNRCPVGRQTLVIHRLPFNLLLNCQTNHCNGLIQNQEPVMKVAF